MNNSIRSGLDMISTINEIRLSLPADRQKVFVILEGTDDISLFAPLLSDNVNLYESYSGKQGLENIVHNHFLNVYRVIGIRDKDYQATPICSQIFYCDYCCAEMMIMSSIECFERFCTSCRVFKSDYGSFRGEILKNHNKIVFLSCARKLNEEQNWGVRFDGIKPNKLFDDNLTIFEGNILSEINNQNPNNVIDAQRQHQICNEMLFHVSEDDLLNITNGHDFMDLFLHYLPNESKINKKTVACIANSSFSVEAFNKTILFGELKNYSALHNVE